MKNKRLFIILILLIAILGIGVGYFGFSQIRSEQLFVTADENANHSCCLKEIVCNYCSNKEAGCHCFDNVINNYSPCDECIDKILTGQGDRLLLQHFAPAIAEKRGREQLASLRAIIDDKYPLLDELGVCTKPIKSKKIECDD